MSYSIKVDKDTCIGCGSCEAICPEGFLMKNGKAVPKKASVEELDCQEEAKQACPVGAISVQKN